MAHIVNHLISCSECKFDTIVKRKESVSSNCECSFENIERCSSARKSVFDNLLQQSEYFRRIIHTRNEYPHFEIVNLIEKRKKR